MAESLLKELVGESSASVVFVMDYVQLDVNGSRFSAYVWPTVTIGNTELDFADRGYRDALCAFSTHEVTAAEGVRTLAWPYASPSGPSSRTRNRVS